MLSLVDKDAALTLSLSTMHRLNLDFTQRDLIERISSVQYGAKNEDPVLCSYICICRCMCTYRSIHRTKHTHTQMFRCGSVDDRNDTNEGLVQW